MLKYRHVRKENNKLIVYSRPLICYNLRHKRADYNQDHLLAVKVTMETRCPVFETSWPTEHYHSSNATLPEQPQNSLRKSSRIMLHFSIKYA